MKLVMGLGNPGRRFAATAHNVGFAVADELARRWNLSPRVNPRVHAELAAGQVADENTIIAKPLTFMNLSGETVATLARQRELGEDDLLVVVDDVNLPIGRIRIRPRGSHGGHNGLRSIIERLGHGNFARLRVGIQPPWEIESLTDYVLSRFPPLQREQIKEMIELATDATEFWIRNGAKAAAERYNGQARFQEPREGT